MVSKKGNDHSKVITVCCGAVAGTTMAGMLGQPIATGTTLPTATTTTGFVLPERRKVPEWHILTRSLSSPYMFQIAYTAKSKRSPVCW